MSNATSSSNHTPMPQLATAIENWISKSQQVASDELKTFMVDLNSGYNLESWAAVDFERILPLRIPKQAISGIMDMVRNALVLVPLAITWLAIWSASRGYSDWYPNHPSSNFLVYWENDLNSIFKLSSIALIDGAILVAIFLMTVGSDLINRNSGLRQELERLHEGLIVSLERGLSSYRFLSLPELNQYASQTVQDIGRASQDVASSIQLIANTAQHSETAMKRLEQIITNDFQPVAARLDQTVQALSAAAGTHNQLVSVVQSAQNGLAATQQQMGHFVSQMQSGFIAELTALRTGVEDMVRNAGGGSQRIVQDFGSALDATIQKLSSTLSQTVSDLARMSTEAADAMSKASDSIENTSDVLKSTMSSVELGVQRMNSDLDKIHQKIK